MPSPRQIAVFFGTFIAIYLLLLIPWPGFRSGWERAFLGVSRPALSALFPNLELTAYPAGHPQGNANCARIQIADLSLLKPDGSGPVRNLDFDAGAFWRCTALLIALGLSTPLPVRDRLLRLTASLALLFAVLLASLWFLVWREAAAITTSFDRTLWGRLMEAVEQGLIQQYSIAIPVVAWVLIFLPGREWWVRPGPEDRPKSVGKVPIQRKA